MATIKMCTDIPQSKVFKKILPLKSADMCYVNGDVGKIIIGEWENNSHDEDNIPAWSLAALLDVLPNNYVDVNDTLYHPNLMKTKDGRCMVIYNVSQCTSLYNNPVDACGAMIERLHELNLL